MIGVTKSSSPASCIEQGLAIVRVAGLALGSTEPDGEFKSEDGLVVVSLGVEVEGLGVVAEGVGGGEGAQRGVARLAGVADGLGQVDRLGGIGPVTGQFADPCSGPVAAEVLQRLGDHSMGPARWVGPRSS